MTVVGLEQIDNIALHRVRGETLNPCSINGFSSRIKDAYFQMSPGAHTTMAIFKKHRLQDLDLIRGETRLVDCLDHQNSLHLQPEHFQQIKTLLMPNSRTDGELQEILIESALMEYFIQRSTLAAAMVSQLTKRN